VLATTGFPPAALAAKKALQVVEVAKTAEDTHKLLVAGGVIAAGIATAAKLSTKRTSVQDFLEATPYWDQATVPVNVYKNKTPFTGKVVSTKRIVGPKATGETCHIVIDHKGGFPVSSK
jgi:ferredoxin--NADP+ reductase